jgi:hypothetical protein
LRGEATMTTTQTDTKPNGPVAAVFLAAGIASLVLGLFVTLAEASPDIKTFLDFSKNYGIGQGVGPLSGKVTIATLAFFISWGVLGVWLRGKEVSFTKVLTASLILVGIGFLLTFPPIFQAFAA